MKYLVLLLFLAGCASKESVPVKTYDLGASAPKAVLPALRAVAVRTAMPFDGVEMYYRLHYRDSVEIAPFANSRWAAPPPELVRRQILRALHASGAAQCALEVELQDFSQVFTAKDASEARIELRASVGTGNSRVASKSFTISDNQAGANAASGASALSRAAERAIGELGAWIAAQPGCKS